ncbi:g6631 [Coccomyxa elongata]
MQSCRSFTSIAACQLSSQGDPEHEALSVLWSTLTQSNHVAVSLQTVQELHDRILDMPVEVLKEHCQLMPDLEARLMYAEEGSPLQIAVSSATQALAGRLSSASLPPTDRQLSSTSTSSEPCRTQPSKKVLDDVAEAPKSLACVKSATDHASCLSALQGLHSLVSNPEGACAVAQADWLGAFDNLLSACPATREDRLLWLPLFRILQLLIATQEQVVALEVKSLLHALVSLYVTNDAASYSCRLRAMLVLKYLVCCVGDTWRFAWEHPGTQWDTQVAVCLGPIISHVCYTWHKRQPTTSRGKAMLKQALQCLTEITRSLPASIWAPAWQQEGGTYWLTNLAQRDPEWQVRAYALELLSRLASPAAPATSCILSQAWRDGPAVAAQMARDVGEAKPVRAAALAFLTATLAARPQPQPASRNMHSLDAPSSIALSDGPQLWQNTAAMWADSATNLAQLMMVLLQSLPAAAAALISSGATLTALLHCYGGAAVAISCSDWDLHSRLMAMQQHVALAIAALCPRHELAGNCQLEVLRHELQGVAVSAALLLSLDPSHVPLQTKLGTCYLLVALLTSREAAVTLFSDSSGEELRHPGTGVPVGASLCKGLADLSSSFSAPAQESATIAVQRSTVAAALSSVLAFSCSAKEAAVETGLLLSLMAAAEEAGDVLASRGHSAPAAQHQMQRKSYGAAPSSRRALSNLSNLCRARVAHRAQQSGAEFGPRHTAGLQQHFARHQLHWALLLLQHLMLDSAMAQGAAADAGGMIPIAKLWDVALEDLEVMQDLLELLKHMVTDSASAQKTFCLQGMPERILALLSTPKPQAATWTPLWAVLRNMAALSHGTSALLKHAPLLPQVLQLARELAQRKQLSRLPPVLALVGNIAAHTQGQRALLTTTAASGLLDLLISLTLVNHTQTNAAAMLVLHALAHAPEAAIHFLAHPSALPCLVTCLGKADVDKKCAAYAASGLWALTYNCQKVKGVLRKIGSWDVALAQAREAFRSVDEKGKSCSHVRGTSDLAHLHALGHRAVAELIQSVPRS